MRETEVKHKYLVTLFFSRELAYLVCQADFGQHPQSGLPLVCSHSCCAKRPRIRFHMDAIHPTGRRARSRHGQQCHRHQAALRAPDAQASRASRRLHCRCRACAIALCTNTRPIKIFAEFLLEPSPANRACNGSTMGLGVELTQESRATTQKNARTKKPTSLTGVGFF